MRVIFLILALFVFLTAFPQAAAFPSAKGSGSVATGGRGGVLIKITTLDETTPLTGATNSAGDSIYTGGLYAALQHPTPAYIIFNVSGNIELGTGGTEATFGFYGIPGVKNKTIWGQSAPRGGITITGGGFRLDGRVSGDNHNLVFRHIRSRPIKNYLGNTTTADDARTWGLLLYGGDSVIVDHCSFSFAHDKGAGAFVNNANTEGVYRMSFTNNLFSDNNTNGYVAMNVEASNPEQRVNHISFIENFFSNAWRTPNMAFDGYGEIINNVQFDNEFRLSNVFHGLNLNHIANYSYGSTSENKIQSVGADTTPLIYSKENYFDGVLTGSPSEDNINIWQEFANTNTPSTSFFTGTKHSSQTNSWASSYVPATDIYDEIVTNGNVGAYKYLDETGAVQEYRDSFDTNALSRAASSDASYTGRQVGNWVLPSIPANTRTFDYDSDNDGMADNWEIAQFGDLSQSYSGDFDGDGYENIEEYMNQVDIPATQDPPSGGGGGGSSAPDGVKNVTSAMLIAH